jgi:RimJ/RimL family protein N-acetyltransferase
MAAASVTCVDDLGELLLATDRLELRRFTPASGHLLVELDSDAEVMHHITGGLPTSSEEIETDVLPAFLGYYGRPGGYGFWAAVLRESEEFSGWFHLRPRADAPRDEPELGYRFRRSAWGRGLATEGSRALIHYAFSSCGAARVVAETMVVHTASRRVMEKCGMRMVRTFHAGWPFPIDGDEHGDVEYAITRAEWLALKRS